MLCSSMYRRIAAVSWRETGSCYRLASHDGLPKHRVTPFNRFILKITRTINPVPNEVRYATQGGMLMYVHWYRFVRLYRICMCCWLEGWQYVMPKTANNESVNILRDMTCTCTLLLCTCTLMCHLCLCVISHLYCAILQFRINGQGQF